MRVPGWNGSCWLTLAEMRRNDIDLCLVTNQTQTGRLVPVDAAEARTEDVTTAIYNELTQMKRYVNACTSPGSAFKPLLPCALSQVAQVTAANQ